MRRIGLVSISVVAVALTGGVAVLRAQDVAPDDSIAAVESVDPYEAVRRGNLLLKQDKPAEALDLYEQAEREKPDAREIAFAEGLAQYHLGDYEMARELFRKAADGRTDALADDAIYSAGTTYHSDALLSLDDPKAAMSDLEEAMRHYQSVLAQRPDHEAARDAYRKAGTMWRQIKQQMQPQQQESPSDQQNDDQDQEDQKQSQEQQQSEQQQEQSDEGEDQKEQSSPSDEQDQEQQSSESQDEEQKQPDPQSAEPAEAQQERVSREQAERKLREMMQALRERKEDRRRSSRLIPVRPVDKDW